MGIYWGGGGTLAGKLGWGGRPSSSERALRSVSNAGRGGMAGGEGGAAVGGEPARAVVAVPHPRPPTAA